MRRLLIVLAIGVGVLIATASPASAGAWSGAVVSGQGFICSE
jgi:hypothetical protein